jgi:hypothetical protein
MPIERFGTFKRIEPVTPVQPKQLPAPETAVDSKGYASQEIRNLARRIDVPQTDFKFLKWKGNPEPDHNDYKGKGHVAKYNFFETLEIADALGLRLPSFMETLDRSKRPDFSHWVWADAVIVQDQGVLTGVYPKKVAGEVALDGNLHKVKTKGDVTTILERAGLYKPSRNIKVNPYAPNFDNKGFASVWSGWYSDVGCFFAYANRPSDRSDYGLAGFYKK